MSASPRRPVLYLIGTKAQYIKMAPVVLESRRQELPHRVVLTGQHRETFGELQLNFGLPDPDHVLVQGGEAVDHSSFFSWLRKAWRTACGAQMRGVWAKAAAVVVHGDTASTLLGALLGRRFSLPVVHVEAGLRSHNFLHPFPEELVRVVVARFTALHLCPDELARRNLRRAGGRKVVTEGNTLKDAQWLALAGTYVDGEIAAPTFVVFSLHRHENLFNRGRLRAALDILRQVGERVPVKFVLHPVTAKRLTDLGLLEKVRDYPGVELLRRMDFFAFSRLIRQSSMVLTDGGSNQEECAMLGIPCVVLRRATERPDGLDSSAIISDLDADRVLSHLRDVLQAGPWAGPSLNAASVSPSAIAVQAIRELTGL